jgi:hypothetical protein
VVDGGRDRRLEERARVLGFDELLAYLQARCDAGHSVPQLAAELGLSDWQVGAALARLAVRLAPRPQRLAAQRRRFTEERIAARVAALGFTDVEAHLGDRVVEHGCCWRRWRRSWPRIGRRAARLAKLGFQDLATYLRVRHVEQGWSVKRMQAELRVGRRWLVGELARLGLRP